MEFDQLKGFYYTAKLRSFTLAAKQLYLSQPAVSLKVKALEEAVGERLLERVGRKVELTAAGRMIFALAEDLIGKLSDVERVVHDLKHVSAGRVAVGASDTTCLYYLPELVRAFRARHPGVELEIESLFSDGVAERVLAREVDVGFVSLPEENDRLSSETLFTQEYAAIVASGHPWATRRDPVTPAEIAAERLVLLGPRSRTRRRMEEYLGRRTPPRSGELSLSSFEIIKRYVAIGLGVSLVPRRALEPAPEGLAVVPLAEPLRVACGVVYRADRRLSHGATEFLARAREHFADVPTPANFKPSLG